MLSRKKNDLPVDAALPPLPINDRGFPGLASVEKHSDWHGEFNIPHSDIHSSIPNFIFRRFVHERRQYSNHLSKPLSLHDTERFGNKLGKMGGCKRIELVNSRCRQTVDSLCRVADRMFRSGTAA